MYTYKKSISSEYVVVRQIFLILDEGTTVFQEDLSGDMMISDDEEGRVDNLESRNTVVSNGAGGSRVQKASSTKKGSKGKDPSAGEKRQRTTFTATQKVYLQQALVKGDLDTVEKSQRAAQTCASESGNPSQAESILNWYRNNKPTKSKEGECAGTGLKTCDSDRFGANDEICM
jgi:hypothetical protein